MTGTPCRPLEFHIDQKSAVFDMKGHAGKEFFRELEHTADLCVEIYGKDRTELVLNAIETLYTLLDYPLDRTSQGLLPRTTLRIEGLDLADALVRLLGELLYAASEEHERFFPKKILLQDKCPPSLNMRIILQGSLWKCSDDIVGQGREIKAVTYHDVCIKKTEHGHMARIVMDV